MKENSKNLFVVNLIFFRFAMLNNTKTHKDE